VELHVGAAVTDIVKDDVVVPEPVRVAVVDTVGFDDTEAEPVPECVFAAVPETDPVQEAVFELLGVPE
jgi:hypothetical protein